MASSTTTQKQIFIQPQHRCFRSTRFNPTFPQELNGIITPEKFYQSMANINHAYRRPLREKFQLCLGPLFFFGGVFLLAIFLSQPIRGTALIPVAVVGAVLLLLSCSMWIPMGNLRETRVKKVLADESMKYSMRSMLSYTWRLEIPRIPSAIDGDGDATIKHLVIEIGSSADSEMKNNTLNSNSAEPTAYIGQQYPILPPSYSSVINSSIIKSYP